MSVYCRCRYGRKGLNSFVSAQRSSEHLCAFSVTFRNLRKIFRNLRKSLGRFRKSGLTKTSRISDFKKAGSQIKNLINLNNLKDNLKAATTLGLTNTDGSISCVTRRTCAVMFSRSKIEAVSITMTSMVSIDTVIDC